MFKHDLYPRFVAAGYGFRVTHLRRPNLPPNTHTYFPLGNASTSTWPEAIQADCCYGADELRAAGLSPHNCGGETTVTIEDENGDMLAGGDAMCHPADNFCRQTGRDIAFARAVRNFYAAGLALPHRVTFVVTSGGARDVKDANDANDGFRVGDRVRICDRWAGREPD